LPALGASGSTAYGHGLRPANAPLPVLGRSSGSKPDPKSNRCSRAMAFTWGKGGGGVPQRGRLAFLPAARARRQALRQRRACSAELSAVARSDVTQSLRGVRLRISIGVPLRLGCRSGWAGAGTGRRRRCRRAAAVPQQRPRPQPAAHAQLLQLLLRPLGTSCADKHRCNEPRGWWSRHHACRAGLPTAAAHKGAAMCAATDSRPPQQVHQLVLKYAPLDPL
jgi:hypothetical protein